MDHGTVLTTDQGVAPREGLTSPDVVQQTQVVAPRDRVRWGPIVAGLLTALALFLLLNVLLVALGLQAVRVGDPNADEALGTGALISGIIGLVCFFIGGFVAARAAAVEGRLNGLLNGFLVWALGLVLIILLAGLGLGGLLGSAGELFGQYRAAGSPQPDVDGGQLVQNIRNAALPAFLGLALPAAAATLGGFIGARDDQDWSASGVRR